MKNITKIVVFFFLIISAAFATDFGAGPDVFAKAYKKVHHGSYSIFGPGLIQGWGKIHNYGPNGVMSSPELMSPWQGLQWVLSFENYLAEVTEVTIVYDVDNNELFTSNQSWKPTETLSDNGKNLSYTMPDHAGSIWLTLADQKIPFSGDFVEVEFEGGWTMQLENRDGYVIVPGWIYQNKGAFVEWRSGRRTVTDIQTGLPVYGGKDWIQTRASGINGLVPVNENGGLYLSIYSNEQMTDIFETSMKQDGVLSVYLGDSWGNNPQGVWITVVGSNKDPVYQQVQKGGYVYVPVTSGQTLHLKLRWNIAIGKG